MPRHALQVEPGAEWRVIGRYLWAGTDETGPIGTIERGRRFRAVDPEGAVLGRCRTLDDAKALLAHVADARRVTDRPAGFPDRPDS